MRANPDLAEFVRQSLARGVPRAEIEAMLRKAGWPADQIAAGLAGYADLSFPIPVPTPQPYLDARDAFMCLVLFSTLYVSAFQLGSLLFDVINLTWPDVAQRRGEQYPAASIRWSIATLAVAFPVFLYTSSRLASEIRLDPGKRHSKVRRWLTYLTLFIAVIVLGGDITSLIYYLLSGELTIRFLLKVVVAALIAGGVFWYYVLDLRGDERATGAR